MPWDVRQRGNRWCVVKQGESSPVPGGCHESKEKARAHQKALYAGEASTTGGNLMSTVSNVTITDGTVKITSPNSISSTTFMLVPVEEETLASDEAATSWEGPIGYEGMATSDRRYLMPGEISERDLPLTLMVQTVSDEGHKGSEVGGRIDEVWREESEDGSVAIMGRGIFDSGDVGQEAARMVEDQVLRGISLDLAVTEAQALDPETFEPIDEEEFDLAAMLNGEFVTGIKGEIMGATLVPFPAFPDARISILTASGNASVSSTLAWKVVKPVLTASAAGKAPLAPPKAWFEMPETDLPCPLTVTDEGQVYGHLALWGQCHAGFKDVCQTPPRSYSDYKFFHLGLVETEEGERVPVGKITVSTGHAPISYGSTKTQEHYDNTGCVAAFVRARDGKRGIWLSGAIRSDLPAEKIRDLQANPPSGDWRAENGMLELQGVLAVPVPGFPVPRQEARLVASGAEEEVEAFISTGYFGSKKHRRRKAMLAARIRQALSDS